MRRPVSPISRQRQPAQLVRPPLLDSQRKRRRICLLLLLALLLGAGGWLVRQLPVRETWQNARQRFSSLLEPAEPVKAASPPPALRGSIYDRNMEELAVSYRIFSLHVSTAELTDREELAVRLAQLVGADSKELLKRLQSAEPTVELAAGLDARQAEEIEELRLPGVFCKPAEARYYPGHAAAGHLLGFVSEGVGLGGIEALYDTALQPGDFRSAEAPEADFAGEVSLGPQAADVMLTIDLKLQKQIELLLDSHRQQTGAAAGSALVIDPDSGRLLAAVRQPAFDPNYFWQTEGEREDGPLFPRDFSLELLRPLFAKAAAIEEGGLDDAPPPAAVSPPERGMSQEALERCRHQFGFDQPVPDILPLDPKAPALEERGGLSAADIAAGAAALLNSGRRVTPWLLKAVHDPDRRRFFGRDMESSPPRRLLPPAAGVQLRRRLLHDSPWGGKDGFLFVSSATAAGLTKNGLSEHRLQELLIAAAPQDMPRLLLVLAVDYGRLNPPPPPPPDAESGQTDSRARLLALGRSVLELLAAQPAEDVLPDKPPPAKNEANLRRFLLSRKLNRPVTEEKNYDPAAAEIMPNLVGLSLRQGLQRLNSHKLQVEVRGSGMIVAQKPAVGTPLANVATCELTLEPFPRHEKPAQAAAKPASRTQRKSPARKSGQPDKPDKP
jgi:cell division protein FtsI (penicillin-binding protein 3)